MRNIKLGFGWECQLWFKKFRCMKPRIIFYIAEFPGICWCRTHSSTFFIFSSSQVNYWATLNSFVVFQVILYKVISVTVQFVINSRRMSTPNLVLKTFVNSVRNFHIFTIRILIKNKFDALGRSAASRSI